MFSVITIQGPQRYEHRQSEFNEKLTERIIELAYSFGRNLPLNVQPPVFGPPFKLVSDDAFSAPSAVLPKVQEVDNSELNVV